MRGRGRGQQLRLGADGAVTQRDAWRPPRQEVALTEGCQVWFKDEIILEVFSETAQLAQ